jgi:hypothetical protein
LNATCSRPRLSLYIVCFLLVCFFFLFIFLRLLFCFLLCTDFYWWRLGLTPGFPPCPFWVYRYGYISMFYFLRCALMVYSLGIWGFHAAGPSFTFDVIYSPTICILSTLLATLTLFYSSLYYFYCFSCSSIFLTHK